MILTVRVEIRGIDAANEPDCNSRAPSLRGEVSGPTGRRQDDFVVAALPEADCAEVRDADAMLNVGADHAAVLQSLEVSEATYLRWRNQYGGMKAEEAKRLKELEEENKRLKEIVADLTLDNRMLKHVAEGNW